MTKLQAIADDGSLSPGREGCWPRAGAEASGQDQASCAGSPGDLQDCWAAIQHPQVSPEPEVKVSLATRTLLFQAVGKPLRLRLNRQTDFQPFHLSEKWLV